MKRSSKVLAAVFAVVFAAGNVFALTVEEEIAELKASVAELKAASGSSPALADVLGIRTEIGGTFVLQGVSKANDGSDKGRIDGTMSFDLRFGREFDHGGIAFMHIEGGDGDGLGGYSSFDDGLDGYELKHVNTYSSLNNDADSSSLWVSELWYEQPLFDNKLVITFGKLNPVGYFDQNAVANDETEQFLASMFVNNTAIWFPGNNLGLRATYSPVDYLDITYAYFNHNKEEEWTHIDSDGWNAIQATFKYSDTGNYRLMFWDSNEDSLANYKGNDDNSGLYGIALSVDQSINETVTLFARYGFRNPEFSEVSDSWSVGAQFKGSMWKRDSDIIGVALGQNMASKDYVDFMNENGGDYKDDSETQAEAYYKFSLNKNVALTPVLQYVMKPLGGNATDDNDLFTFGIRTQINF